jgi:hypothetical protein
MTWIRNICRTCCEQTSIPSATWIRNICRKCGERTTYYTFVTPVQPVWPLVWHFCNTSAACSLHRCESDHSLPCTYRGNCSGKVTRSYLPTRVICCSFSCIISCSFTFAQPSTTACDTLGGITLITTQCPSKTLLNSPHSRNLLRLPRDLCWFVYKVLSLQPKSRGL